MKHVALTPGLEHLAERIRELGYEVTDPSKRTDTPLALIYSRRSAGKGQEVPELDAGGGNSTTTLLIDADATPEEEILSILRRFS